MLNYIWTGMILIGIVVGSFTGHLADVTNAAILSAKEAVSVSITMLGIVSMWMGLMKIAEKAGAIEVLTQKMMPLLRFLFPDIPRQSKAFDYIATNILANFLGLGWGATPAGLKAMSELQKLNKNKDTASRSMCAFMIINMTALQIVSVNIVAFRTQYNSANPSEIIGPGILATLITAFSGVLFIKLAEGVTRK